MTKYNYILKKKIVPIVQGLNRDMKWNMQQQNNLNVSLIDRHNGV